MISFNLDKRVGLNYYEQIKGQLLSAIYCGKIKEGDRLPSMRELSEELGVNYKTIRKIYLRLAKENYIEIVQGSGAFLQKRKGQDDYEKMRRKALFKLIQEVADRARHLAVAPQKFARLLEAYANGESLRELALLVVDDPEEALIFSRELRMRTGAEVRSISLTQLEEARSHEWIRRCDYLLTTSWHLEQVSRFARELEKEVLEIKPSHDIYTEIWTAARHQNVAIVIQDEKTMHASWDVFMNIFYPSTDKKFWIAPIQRKDLIQKILEEADLIFVSPVVWDEMRKMAPAHKKLKTYQNFISDETIYLIRELQLLG